MAAVARPRPNHLGGATLVTGTTLNIILRSHYGRKALGNMTRAVLPARNFVVPKGAFSTMAGCVEVLPSVDLETKRRYNEMMKWHRRKSSSNETRKEFDIKLKGLTEEDNFLEARTVSLPYRYGSTLSCRLASKVRGKRSTLNRRASLLSNGASVRPLLSRR